MSDYPYPGLRPFNRDETDIFFGREEQTDALLDRLANNHFLAVVGLSGCGKSSLVKTGLLAGLESGFLSSAGVHWKIAELRPGHSPYTGLTNALMKDDVFGEEYNTFYSSMEEAAAFMLAGLRRGPFGLHELLEDCPMKKGQNLLILVDQFEELFRFHRQIDSEESAAFVALLIEASKHNNIYIVLTMRSDFLGECAIYAGLPEAINEGIFLTPRLSREQLRRAIEYPASVFGTKIDPVLVNKLLNDVGTEHDQLPLLQHVLLRMWETCEEGKDGVKFLSMKNYKKVGGFKDALSLHADMVFNQLGADQQKIAEKMFRGLCERESEGRDTRRPLTIRTISQLVDTSFIEVIRIIEKFRAPGKCFLMPPAGVELKGNTIIDISHESLIRQWKSLKSWTREEAADAEMYRRVENAALQWIDEKKKNKELLWTSKTLNNVKEWKHNFDPNELWASWYGKNGTPGKSAPYFDDTISFIEASSNHRKNKKLRDLAIFFIPLLIIFAVFFDNRQDDFKFLVFLGLGISLVIWLLFRYCLAFYRVLFK